MAFAIEPKAKGDEDKVFTALRRLQEEDPTIDVHRDEQTGEQIVAGLTQIHVEVIVDRMKERFGAEVTLQAAARALPRDDQGQAKAHGRYKKQTGGRGQFGDCHIEIEPIARERPVRVREQDQGRRDPVRVHPRGREGRARGDGQGHRGRLPAARREGAPVRRLVPLGGLVGDGVQDGRLDGLQAGRRAGAGRACSSRS